MGRRTDGQWTDEQWTDRLWTGEQVERWIDGKVRQLLKGRQIDRWIWTGRQIDRWTDGLTNQQEWIGSTELIFNSNIDWFSEWMTHIFG